MEKREIKFRGLRVNYTPIYGQSKWMYGNLLNNCSIGEVGYDLTSYTYAEVTPETVGQYTGLKDKNGKEIYEGDIVSYCGFNNAIKWNNVECCFGLFRSDSYKHDLSADWVDENGNAPKELITTEIEVIGNIYENPELL